MDEATKEMDLSHWFSTYGFITAERILGRYQIHIPQNELAPALKNPRSFYHRIVQVPFRNVLNGIIFQQASDYHVYVQKLFVDYLLSAESAKEEGAQGALTRRSMEDERKNLVELGEEFQQRKLEHNVLISSSQKVLIKCAAQWNTALESAIKALHGLINKAGFSLNKSQIRHAIHHAIAHSDVNMAKTPELIDKMNNILAVELTTQLKIDALAILDELLIISDECDSHVHKFDEEIRVMNEQANSFRTQFYETILRVISLIQLLPDYRIDEVQDQINREPLHFDKHIGA